MRLIQEAVFLFATLSAMSVIADAQDTYANCSTNYTILENALLGTSDNIFQLSSTYFNPEFAYPIYVDVFYHFDDTNVSARYIWSASSLYLIVPPRALQHLSLFFSYFEKGTIAKLHLKLPVDCLELKNVTKSTRHNFLFVLTHRLRVFAKNYRSLDYMILPDGFEARVVSYDERDETFDANGGTHTVFSFVIMFPFFALFFFISFVRSLHTYLSDALIKTEHHSTQAALVCVGQFYTLYVFIMDVLAITKGGMYGVIIAIAIMEIVFLLFVVVFVCIFCCPTKRSKKIFWYFCLPLFWKLVEVEDVRQWFVIVGLTPPLVCLSSHIGFIIEGWVSSNSHGTAVMLLSSCLFVSMFIAFQSMYSVVTFLLQKWGKKQQKPQGPQHTEPPKESQGQQHNVSQEGPHRQQHTDPPKESQGQQHNVSQEGPHRQQHTELPEESQGQQHNVSQEGPHRQQHTDLPEESQGQQHNVPQEKPQGQQHIVITPQPEQQGEQHNRQKELNFCTLTLELFIGIPIVAGILVYIGYGVINVPIIRDTEGVVTHVYNFGHTASIFVVFIFTYIIFFYKRN